MNEIIFEDYMKKAALMKMAFERHQTYLSSIRAVVHLFYQENIDDKVLMNQIPYDYICHVIKLMDNDLKLVNELFSHQVDTISEQVQ